MFSEIKYLYIYIRDCMNGFTCLVCIFSFFFFLSLSNLAGNFINYCIFVSSYMKVYKGCRTNQLAVNSYHIYFMINCTAFTITTL